MLNPDQTLETALEWYRIGNGVALATVIETWGSAPRRVGSQLVIDESGRIEGSVSGGCVEGAVIIEAMEALQEGAQRLLEYGVTDEDAFEVGLACGGKIRILVEPVGSVIAIPLLSELVDARQNRKPVAYEVDLNSGNRCLVYDKYVDRMRLDQSGFEDNNRFITVFNPPLRLIIVGAVHIAQSLVPMARIAGYDPIIVDPREVFGSSDRFPSETLLLEWPDEALRNLGLDSRTALVLLTHDTKLDDAALEIALRSNLFYIGALGSNRTHVKRVERLRKLGFSEDEIGRIHGPIGLDIGAAGPSEIAISILAEMTSELRGKPV
ncbi:MAG: XdhC family protein [Aestuariivita sp.]|nr:XdhC family protein [Aestuariivita sp.]